MIPSSRRRLPVIAAIVLALGIPATSQAATPSDTAPRATVRKVALGVSQNPDNGLAELDAFTAAVGRTPAIWSVWHSWGANALPDPVLFEGLKARGVVPMVFWEPTDPSNLSSKAFTFNKIIRGNWDGYIRAWAQAAKAHGATILLKFAHEMNGKWFPWGVGNSSFPANTASRFRAAWRHVHDLIRGPGGEGATNVKMLWSIWGSCQPGQCPASPASLYPGNAYVQYVGFSVFDWNGVLAMNRIFASPVSLLQAVSSKPIVVTETGTRQGSHKPGWITKGYHRVYNAYPRIRAIVYFDVDSSKVNQPDWRLTSPAEAQTAYAAVVAQPRFQGTIK
jgi:hypothetical protein